jgi:hypothetical protein
MPLEIKDRQKFLLIIAGTALLLLVGDSFVFTPLTNSWKARSLRIEELRKQVADGTRMVNREDVIRSHWDNMRTNALPSNVSQAEAEMLKAFDRWERTAGVTRVSIKPQWKQPEDDYMTLECRADYTGDMSRLSRFLYEVENDPMGVKVDNVEISSRDDSGRQLSLGLQVSGLLLNPPPQAQQP